MSRAVIVGLGLLLAGCGASEARLVDVAEDEAAASARALGSGVRLLEAHAVIGTTRDGGRWYPHRRPLADLGYGPALTSLVRGVVAVDAPRDDSRVFVHFESRASNEARRAWQVVEARRVDARHFEFATAPYTLAGGYHYLPRFVHTFAVEHRTGDGSRWDNNDGRDYVVSGDDDGGWVPVHFGPPALLGARDLVVEQAHWDGEVLRGTVLVRNVGGEKAVRVVASTSAWATSQQGEARYVKTFSASDLERWSFELPAPATEREAVVFAVALEAPGREASWDNNLGRDYRLALDGVDSPWALGPVASPGKVVFEGPERDWQVRVVRAPPADGAFTLVYAPGRLPTCRGRKYGRPTWSITAHLRGEGGAFTPVAFLRDGGEYPEGALYAPLQFIPGPTLEAYFFNGDAYGCHTWDSNYGQNFLVRWAP